MCLSDQRWCELINYETTAELGSLTSIKRLIAHHVSTPERFCSSWPEQKCSSDADFAIAEAMAIKGDRILAVGDEATVRKAAGPEVTIVDLKGNVVLPGFIDAHIHPLAGAASQAFENVGVDRFRSVEDALDYMKKTAAEATGADWHLFINLDLATQSYAEAKLTTEVLDAISNKTPVAVWHAGGHRMTVNSRLLEIMGVTAGTPNPPGAEYGRYLDGTPDGNVAGSAALFAALGKIRPYANYNRKAGAIALARKWMSEGMTTLGIAGVTTPADWKVLLDLASNPAFSMRTRSYLQWGALPLWDEAGVKPGVGNAKVRVIGWKISTDGSNQAYTGLQREPYLNREDRGLPYMTRPILTERSPRALNVVARWPCTAMVMRRLTILSRPLRLRVSRALMLFARGLSIVRSFKTTRSRS